MFKRYVTNTYEIVDTFENIYLDAKDAQVKIEPSDGGNTKLVFFEKKRSPYDFSITDGTLIIKSTKTKWYNYLKIGVNHSKIKLCISKSALEKISIGANVGHVDMCSIICNGDIDIQINTGNVSLENVSCKSLNTKGNTGYVTLNKFVAAESITIKRNTGKVSLNDCSAPEIFVRTNMGKVSGKLPSNTVFDVRTNTGKVEVPKPSIGEAIGSRCEIKTNTGNIKFE